MWSAAGTAERKQSRLQLSSLRLYIGQSFDLSVLFFSVCMRLFVALKGLERQFWGKKSLQIVSKQNIGPY